jgi:myb proto-oncogene protein
LDAQTYRYMADATLTASPDDTVAIAPTDAVTVPASLPNAGDLRARKPSYKWMPEEDVKLLEAVKELGKDWAAVAAMVPGRTTKRCCCRWAKSFDPAINTGRWAAEEDAKLADAVKKHGSNWVTVAAMVQGRTNTQCSSRWHKYLGKRTTACVGTPWKVEEDAKLTGAAVKELGSKWTPVAAMVPSRSIIQCRRRWVTHLDPIIDQRSARKGKWTTEEDAKLFEAVAKFEKFGRKWIQVAAMVPGRSNTQCCSRWHEAVHPLMNGATKYTDRTAQG